MAKLIESVYKVSDFLERQALREKEKRKERMLTVLPAYLEQQISGITDEKTLFSTLPKISAELYSYGADVGNAANQILGTLAQSKYKELAIAKQERQNKETFDVMKGIYGKVPLGEGDKKITYDEMMAQYSSYSPEIVSGLIPELIKAHQVKTTGIGYESGNKTYFQTYKQVGYGDLKPDISYEFKPTGKGTFGLDNLATKEIENEPLTPEAMKYLADKMEYESRLQDQLGKSLALQKSSIDYQMFKQDEAYRNAIKKKTFYHMDTGEFVKMDVDEQGNPYFYKETRAANFPGFGTSPDITIGKNERIAVTDVSRLQEVGQFTQAGPSATTLNSEANILLKTIGDGLVSKGYAKKEDLQVNNFYDQALIRNIIEDTKDPSFIQALANYDAQVGKTVNTITGQKITQAPPSFAIRK